MRKILRYLIFFLLLASTRLYAANYFIDYAGGNDLNDGLTKTTPWKHAPGMWGCTGNCTALTVAQTDRFIFKEQKNYIF